jgi:hypothetical protein
MENFDKEKFAIDGGKMGYDNVNGWLYDVYVSYDGVKIGIIPIRNTGANDIFCTLAHRKFGFEKTNAFEFFFDKERIFSTKLKQDAVDYLHKNTNKTINFPKTKEELFPPKIKKNCNNTNTNFINYSKYIGYIFGAFIVVGFAFIFLKSNRSQ